ncbi:MAG: hypothetical protein PHR61_02320 [Candidatus Absconditabacteria bacterium]|nr:hypothetical protein [Candidatus Absconditabacteria bacterium]
MEDTKKTWSIYKVYLLIASLVGLIGSLISLGIALTALGQRLVITNNEYVNGQRYYEMQQCKEAHYYGKTAPKDENRRPSEEQIKECEIEREEQILLGRNIHTKESILGGGIRAILFMILFFTHYPKFRKENHA